MSNNKQQTAVEYLVEQLFPKALSAEQYYHIEQAKAMHKEEHGQTWDKSMENFEARGRNEMRAYTDFDDYYRETYEQD